MKPIKVLFIFSVLTTVTIYFSCSDNFTETPDYSIQNVESFLKDYNENLLPHKFGKHLTGKIQFKGVNDQMFVVHIETETADNYFYLLQGCENCDFEDRYSKGEIVFLRNQLFVNSLVSDKSALINLSNTTVNPFFGELNAKTHVIGFGIGEHIGKEEIFLTQSAEAGQREEGVVFYISNPVVVSEVSCKCRTAQVSYPDDCDHGGTGSSSCSVSNENESCSVTCETGTAMNYYACCMDD